MDAMTALSVAPPVVASNGDQVVRAPVAVDAGAVSAVPVPAPQPASVGASGEQGQVTNQNQAGSQGPVDLQTLQKAVDKVSHVVQLYNNELEFSVDNDSGRTVVKLVDKQTNEVVRQIPDKEMLALAKDLDRLVGVFVNNRA